jgi:glycosyltransferase involved in cell wall biosynthesis
MKYILYTIVIVFIVIASYLFRQQYLIKSQPIQTQTKTVQTGLKKIAKPNIEFLGHISDEEKTNVLSGARAFIHPQMEDFGITAVEAMACGRPVIAFSQGGATETVLPNETGIFFHSQTWEALLDTVLHFNHENWDSAKIREHAAKFDAHNFKISIKKYINDRYEEFQKGLNQETLLTHVPSL